MGGYFFHASLFITLWSQMKAEAVYFRQEFAAALDDD